MSYLEQISVLSVGVPNLPRSTARLAIHAAPTGREAFAMMRVLQFDLLLAGLHIPDMTVWSLVQRVRMGWPGQRWALVSQSVSAKDEIQARTLGALWVLDQPPNDSALQQLASALLKKRAVSTEVNVEST